MTGCLGLVDDDVDNMYLHKSPVVVLYTDKMLKVCEGEFSRQFLLPV